MNRGVIEYYVQDFFPSDFPDVDVLVRLRRQGKEIRECPVSMSTSNRRSKIHGGLRPIYYVYKMILSLWLAGSVRADKTGGAGMSVKEG